MTPGSKNPHTSSMPAPVSELTATTSPVPIRREAASSALAKSSAMSALVKTTTGAAPLCQARTRRRSSRRGRKRPSSEHTTNTLSTLAASTWALSPVPALPRTMALRRASTPTTDPNLTTTQSPTVGASTGSRPWAISGATVTRSSPEPERTVSAWRSTRATRAGKAPSTSWASKAAAKSGPHPSAESAVGSVSRCGQARSEAPPRPVGCRGPAGDGPGGTGEELDNKSSFDGALGRNRPEPTARRSGGPGLERAVSAGEKVVLEFHHG